MSAMIIKSSSTPPTTQIHGCIYQVDVVVVVVVLLVLVLVLSCAHTIAWIQQSIRKLTKVLKLAGVAIFFICKVLVIDICYVLKLCHGVDVTLNCDFRQFEPGDKEGQNYKRYFLKRLAMSLPDQKINQFWECLNDTEKRIR